jgi:hypothetical protein
MYTFGLTRTPRPGRKRELAELTKEIAGIASDVTDIAVEPYACVFGAPVGRTTFYASIESYAELGHARAKLADDSRYQDLIEGLGKVSNGSGDARLWQIPAGPAPVFLDLLTVDTGLALLARMGDAIAFAMKIAGVISSKAGQNTVFAADMYGPLGSVAWITPASSYAQLDEQAAAIMSDEQYKKLMSEAPLLFDAGRFDRRLEERIS